MPTKATAAAVPTSVRAPAAGCELVIRTVTPRAGVVAAVIVRLVVSGAGRRRCAVFARVVPRLRGGAAVLFRLGGLGGLRRGRGGGVVRPRCPRRGNGRIEDGRRVAEVRL